MKNIDGEEAEIGECHYCGKTKPIYAKNYCDPYMTELYPEEDADAGDWCESCWDTRKGDI